MKKYETDHLGEKTGFSIPLTPDEEGMVGRECHNSVCKPKYFKIDTKVPDGLLVAGQELSQVDLICPYCGISDNIQKFNTEDQTKMVTSMISRDVSISLQNMLKETVKNSKTLSFKAGNLPKVHSYVEEKLKSHVVCDNCGFHYAIYGISFHCPLCGKGNLIQHLNRSAEITRILIKESINLQPEYRGEVTDRMIGNTLEDVVGIFEGFLKFIYQYGVRSVYPKSEEDNKIEKIRVTFQRVEGANNLFIQDLKYDIFSSIPNEDKTFLEEQFLKRHVLTHNLGLVDKKYLEKVKNFGKEGSQLEIAASDVSRALEIVVKIVTDSTRHIVI